MCNVLDWATKPGECAGEAASNAMSDAIDNMANSVMEAFGKAVASLGTMWVNVGTPNLTGSGGSSSSIAAGSSAPNSANITTVLGYVTWVSFAVAAMSLVILGALIATRIRAGEGFAAVGRIGVILGAVVLIGGATGLVSGLLPDGPRGAGGTVLFLQSALWWYMGAGAVLSIIIGGVRMAWEQRAEPGRETVRSLLTLIVVAGAGVTIVGLLVAVADAFSRWVLNGSLNCDVASGSSCFGENMLGLLALTSNPATGGLGSLLIIILGLMAVLAAAFQIVLMVARGGMLVILTGILPLAASATNTEMGKHWFRKCVSWLVAFILYKPAAAIVYAAAFQLVGTNVFQDDGSGLLAVLTGLMLMVIALFALPALMRFVTPMVGAMAAGGGAGVLAAGALAALPTGAAAVGRLASGSGGGSTGSGGGGNSEGDDGASGAAASRGPSGPSGSDGSGGANGSSGAQAAGGGGTTGAAAGGGSGAAAGGAAASGAAAGGAAAGGAAAGGAAAGGAAAGAAAGPVGMAAGAAVDVARGAASAVRKVSEESTGEGGGPSGSR